MLTINGTSSSRRDALLREACGTIAAPHSPLTPRQVNSCEHVRRTLVVQYQPAINDEGSPLRSETRPSRPLRKALAILDLVDPG